MTGETRCPLDRTVKTISLTRDGRVAPHKARTTALPSPPRLESVTEATATPWSASRVTSVLMVRSRRSQVESWGMRRRALRPAKGCDVAAKLAESRRQRERDTPEQDCRGAPFALDTGAGLDHADVLARELQPVLRLGDRPLQGGCAQRHYLNIVRIARQSWRCVAGAHILEGEWGPHLQVSRCALVQNGGEGRPSAHTPAGKGTPPPSSRLW